ncbi:MAG: helix-turn-helix domain-containing protein [Deltaproteobacteria bacterium]
MPANVWSDLARVRWENAPEASKAAKVASSSSGRELNLARCVAECERAALQAALARAQGSRTEAARILGISSRGVYNKIRKYRLLASS